MNWLWMGSARRARRMWKASMEYDWNHQCNHHYEFCEIWCRGKNTDLSVAINKNRRLNWALIPLLLLTSHSRQVHPQCQKTAWERSDNWYLGICWYEPRKWKQLLPKQRSCGGDCMLSTDHKAVKEWVSAYRLLQQKGWSAGVQQWGKD